MYTFIYIYVYVCIYMYASMEVDWPSRRALSGSFDRTLKLWDLESACCVDTFRGHKGSALSPFPQYSLRGGTSGS